MMQNPLVIPVALLLCLPMSTVAQAHDTAAANSWIAPLSLDGHPDLQGTWRNKSATPLERPKQLEGRPFLSDDEVAELQKRAARIFQDGHGDQAMGDAVFLAALTNQDTYRSSIGGSYVGLDREFDNRTALIIDPPDGKIPAYTPAGRQRWDAFLAAAMGTKVPAGPQDLTAMGRCITFGAPRLGGPYGAGMYGYHQIVQTPDYVVFFTEAIHEARVISLNNQAHLPPSIRTWSGDSRGRWEGDTLVVDTTNFSEKTNFRGAAEDLHLVERFKRISPEEIRYEITVDAPGTWVRPWTAMIRLKRSEEKMYEYACHENNAGIMASTLSAARAAGKAADQPLQDK